MPRQKQDRARQARDSSRHSLVEEVLSSEDDRRRFYREHGLNRWYRDQLQRIIDLKIDRLVRKEEEAEPSEYTSLVAERRALREYKYILSILDGATDNGQEQ